MSLFLAIACGEDYQEKGIEGRWQLQSITDEKNQTIRIDTIFYAFKKSVCEYQKIVTPTQFFHCFGNYQIHDKELVIEIDSTSFSPWELSYEFDWATNKRKFEILEHTASKLELASDGQILHLRKY